MAEIVDGRKFWEADHTGLVHVLWRAERDGLSLQSGEATDALATRILESEWFDAVLAHADTIKRMRGSRHGRGVPVCPRCGNGLPNCVSRKPDGTRYTHAETCATYRWADDVCPACDVAMAQEDAPRD